MTNARPPDPASAPPPSPPTQALAYEVDGRRVPPEVFYALACDPQRSVAVEACAGAGKTWMLVSRIVRALLEGAQPHEILAITFTKKAAGEMRARLQEWLAQFAAGPLPTLENELRLRGLAPEPARAMAPRLQALQAQLLAAGRPVQVRTFHSWFAALLRSAPLGVLESLGLPAAHELIEDDGQAIARVWRRFHQQVADSPLLRADYEACIAAHGRTQTRKALEAALAKRVEFGLADAAGVVARSVSPWWSVFADLAPSPPGPVPPDGDAPVPVPADLLAREGAVRAELLEAARWLGRAPQPSYAAAGERLLEAVRAGDLAGAADALLTREGDPRKFSASLQGLPAIRAGQALAQRLQAAQAQHEAWLHHHRLTRLVRRLVEAYAALKRDMGWVDMPDVERAALALLADPVLSGWMQERLDARVSHLLVDEFQDTNPLQWQALHAWLSGYAGAGAGQAPSVFLVGDPKQSIYRFRRAEPQVFRAAQDFVVDALGGVRLGCDHTRRNSPEVLAVVNAVMAQAQADGGYDGFRPHTTGAQEPGGVGRLPPVPRPAAGAAGPDPGPPVWRDSLTTPRLLPEERLMALECGQAARWIAAQVAAGRAPGDVMVLARRRKPLVEMQAQLAALGIAAWQPEKADLGTAPEVQDLVALLDVLVSPGHDLALARVLKSPLVGADDADLARLALRAKELAADGRPASWWQLLQEPDGSPPPALAGLGARLARWQAWVQAWPPHDALDAIFHDADVLARYAGATPTAARPRVLGHLRALLQAALEVAGGRFLTPYAFVRAMRAGGISGPMVAGEQVVRLLTVHGAKGLEAPVVVLLDTDAAAARAETMSVLVDWPGEAAVPRRFAFLASEARPPACCADWLAAEMRARRREELNGLYVAMTRAQGQLVVSSTEPHIADGGSWWRRVEPLAAPLALAESGAGAAGPAPGGQPPETIQLPVVSDQSTQEPSPLPSLAPDAPAESDAARARLGEALHRLLEGVPLGAPVSLAALPGLVQQVAREFRLTAGKLAEAVAMAERILGGDGAWAWDPAQVDWVDNEVPLHLDGALLRIDRLVRRREDGAWWVLDYKSAASPQLDEALVAQLRRYQAAVQAVEPRAAVQAAFLTASGRMVMLPPG